jgi:protein transport protein SEC61 subunit gamma-like protein
MEVGNVGETVVKPLKEFGKNSVRLVKRCTKPDRKGEPFGEDCRRLMMGRCFWTFAPFDGL